MLHLEQTATLLQKIHFPEYITGYRLYLHPDGSWTSRPNLELASILVQQDKIRLFIHDPIISVSQDMNDELMSLTLDEPILIFYLNWSYTLSGYAEAPNWWPYCAKISIPPILTRHPINEALYIGRKKDAHINLSSSGHCDNIIWKPDLTYLDSIPTPSGNIPKNRFATDMINVSSHHGTFTLVGSNVLLTCESTQCPIFLRRPEDLIILSPNDQNATAISCVIQVNDEMLIGNHCFNVKRLPDKTLKSPASVNSLLKGHSPADVTDHMIFQDINTPNIFTNSKVIAISEKDWELSLHSAYRIKIIGWLLKGQQSIGNHINNDICIPENQSRAHQKFSPLNYATTDIGWNQALINIIDKDDFEVLNDSTDLLKQIFTVHRRDSNGKVGLSIQLNIIDDSPIPGGLLLKVNHSHENVNAMFHVAVHEEMTQLVQLCQHACTIKIVNNKLRIIAPEGLQILQQHAEKWHTNKTHHLELEANELAIIDSILIQFIHEDITVIDRPHSFGSPNI